ncbi:HTH-type transcriptional regulator SarZ [Saliniradius amylolyticus]|uniref:HTH-type transcriptional regulator SarZ n=1 Tax=Saliniradius amylolyticus TaxID=2183582 RepID=A0A2S2E0Q0_9ALTE|nr:MarR family transcriptional regulator [Saliniradius amylolyticus]AWL11112.1 HTH-type transcriptional regulator SarZ [Saliniradius amylolyticus]
MEKHDELLVSLRRVIRAIDLRSKELERTVGLTGPQLMIMLELQQRSGTMVKKLAEKTNLSPATVTSILDRLELKGLINRVRSTEDKRRVSLTLTDKGEEILAGAPKPLQANFINQFDQLHDWEQSQLVASMQRIASMMDAADLDASPFLEVGGLRDQQKTS